MDLEKVNSLKDKGNKAYSIGKYDEAISHHNKGLEELVGLEDKRTAGVLHSNMSQTYLKKGDYSEAIKHANESLELDPSLTRSILRRATANAELGNVFDAMKDLRTFIAFEPNNKAAKELMRRLSDKPKMNQKLHEAYAKNYMRPVMKRVGEQFLGYKVEPRPVWFQNALLRQAFLSMKGLDIAHLFFHKTTVAFAVNQRVLLSFHGWISRQFMWLKYPFSPVLVMVSTDLLKILYDLLQPGTLSMTIYPQTLMNENEPLDKYEEVMLIKEIVLPEKAVDSNDLKMMNRFSNGITRLLYSPGLANFNDNLFPRASSLTFDSRFSISQNFLQLWKQNEWLIESLSFVRGLIFFLLVWKQNEWLIESLSFVRGFSDFQAFARFQQFDGVISNKVSNVFLRWPEQNKKLEKVTYNEMCGNLSILKNVFPALNEVTILHWYQLQSSYFPIFVRDISLIRDAYEAITTKPDWCSKLKVTVFVELQSSSPTEFKTFDVKLLEQVVESLREKHPEMRIRLCGPRSYEITTASTFCVPVVIEFENKAAQFELAISAILG